MRNFRIIPPITNRNKKRKHTRLLIILLILLPVILWSVKFFFQTLEFLTVENMIDNNKQEKHTLESPSINLLNLNPQEQINYFAEKNGILSKLVRYRKRGELVDIHFPLNQAEVEPTYINFQLTKFLTSLQWTQTSGEEIERNTQLLAFIPPNDNFTYRFRLYYDQSHAYPPRKQKICVIIKGFGEMEYKNLEQWLTINNNLVYSVLPINRISTMNAKALYHKNLEFLLELPLENAGYPIVKTESYAIFAHYSGNKINSILRTFYRRLPKSIGVITHQGSLITTDKSIMPLILKFIKKKNGYFIDDKSNETSIAFSMAQDMMIPSFEKTITFIPRLYQNDIGNIRLSNELNTLQNNPLLITLEKPDQLTFDFVQKLLQLIVQQQDKYELVRISEL